MSTRQVRMPLHWCAAVLLASLCALGPVAGAGATAVEESPPPVEQNQFIVPIEGVVPAEDIAPLWDARGTRIGVYVDGERVDRMVASGPNDYPEHVVKPASEDEARRDAEEAADADGLFDEALGRAGDVRPRQPGVVTVVSNHTPCHANLCESILVDVARRAAERGVPLRLIFTGAYTPNEETVFAETELGGWIRQVRRYGGQVLVGSYEGQVKAMANVVAWHLWTTGQRDNLTPVGSAQSLGPLFEQSSENGGIDLRTVELRYLSEPEQGGALEYAVVANRDAPDASTTGTSLQLQSDAFFTWLALPTSTFWVNLRPDEPDRIIDPQLARTDAGRVLLDADLEMKRTSGELLHPHSPTGAQFWAQLRPDANGQYCFFFRIWIVPAPATIYEDGDGVHILDAPVTVMLEAEHEPIAQSGPLTGCQDFDPAVVEHNDGVFRTLILPEIERRVNESPEYAAFRQVYLSRVAAEWYRQRSAAGSTGYGELIDAGLQESWTSRQPWSPTTMYDAYLESSMNGEFNITEQATIGGVEMPFTYFYGGVDFSRVPFRSVSAAEAEQLAPGVVDAVGGSLDQPTTDGAGRTWLGATVTPAVPLDPSVPIVTLRPVAWIDQQRVALLTTVLVGVAFAGFAMLRERRSSRPLAVMRPSS